MIVKEQGVTFGDILVLVAVLGVIAYFVLPVFRQANSSLDIAMAARDLARAEPMKMAITEYYAERGIFPQSLEELGLSPGSTGEPSPAGELLSEGVIRLHLSTAEYGAGHYYLELVPTPTDREPGSGDRNGEQPGDPAFNPYNRKPPVEWHCRSNLEPSRLPPACQSVDA